MSAPGSGPLRPFTEDERRTAVTALRAYRFETEQYLRGSGFTPCHPSCEHCKPRAAHFEEIASGLRERLAVTLSALEALCESTPARGSKQAQP